MSETSVAEVDPETEMITEHRAANQPQGEHPGSAVAPVLQVRNLDLWYGKFQALKQVSMDILPREVTALIGPSGCGKSSLIRCFNRMNDLIGSAKVEGEVRYRDHNIYDKGIDPVEVRRWIGMVFQKPNPFPKSIYDNVAFGPRINGFRCKLDHMVERSLRQAALWDEVKDELKKSGLELSGGQQQRLCIARALAVEPEVLLMDEPCSALDPIATSKIEDLIHKLKDNYTVVIVTHNMQQAARVSDKTAFMYLGELVELNHTKQLFENPNKKQTEDYITGKFG